MTHAEARELLEIATAEPGGLERLAAGDTAESSALAAHLAGCDACREEYGRLHRVGALLRTSLATELPVDLRERTLARVAAEGRPRSPTAVGDRPPAALTPPADPAFAASGNGHVPASDSPTPGAPVPIASRPGRPTTMRPGLGTVAAWAASLAAAVALSVGLSWAVVVRPVADAAAADRAAANGLGRLTATTVAVESRPDARTVSLTSSDGAAGVLAFSPGTRELVVVATGLSEPAEGGEYACWMEANGTRTQLGKMYFIGDVAAWEGPSNVLATVPANAAFGVTLVDAQGFGGRTVLSGTLGAS